MISSKELIEDARRQGYKLELRTLRDYVNKGLLPKPVTRKRQQEKGQGGGMIAFYPDKTKNMLGAILKSRNQGLGLEEIKKKLYDHEAWEFIEILSMLKRNPGVDIIQDYGLREIITEDGQKFSPFGIVFLKYLHDGIVPTEFINKTAEHESKGTFFIEKPEEIFVHGLTGSFEKMRSLFLTMFGWDAKEKLKYLMNFAIEHLQRASDAQRGGLVVLDMLYAKLDESSRKTKEGTLIHTEAKIHIDRLAYMDLRIKKLKEAAEAFKKA